MVSGFAMPDADGWDRGPSKKMIGLSAGGSTFPLQVLRVSSLPALVDVHAVAPSEMHFDPLVVGHACVEEQVPSDVEQRPGLGPQSALVVHAEQVLEQKEPFCWQSPSSSQPMPSPMEHW
jgi:hypothetical protein